MNSITPHEDDVLARALRGQVDGMTQAPLTFEAITGRAGIIRRRRRAAVAGGVAAAVAAIAIPTAILSGGGLARSDEPQIATNSPTDSPTESVTPTPAPTATESAPPVNALTPFDLAGIPTGAGPALAYVDGRTLHRAGGSTVRLPAPVWSLARAGDRYLALAATGTDAYSPVLLIGSDGAVADTGDATRSLAGSSSGLTAAYATADGEIRTFWSEGDLTLSSPQDTSSPVVRAVIGEGSCAETAGGCQVFYLGARGVRMIDSQGTDAPIAGKTKELSAATSTSGRWVAAVERSASDSGSCWDVVDPDSTVWGSCDLAVSGFSPDAAYAVASDSYFDGFGPSDLAIVDASDGTVLVHLGATEQSQVTAFDPVWEDSEHVLTVVYHAGEWSVVRVGVDGSLEYAVPPVAGDDMQRPFIVQSR
jgi:hypothetical protein